MVAVVVSNVVLWLASLIVASYFAVSTSVYRVVVVVVVCVILVGCMRGVNATIYIHTQVSSVCIVNSCVGSVSNVGSRNRVANSLTSVCSHDAIILVVPKKVRSRISRIRSIR